MASLILMMGPTGSGKSAQGEIAASAHGWTHVSSGALLRQSDGANSSAKAGDLASSHTIESLLQKELDKAESEDVVVLDGFPRTQAQARWLERYNEVHDNTISHVVVLDVTKDVSRARLDARKRGDDGLAAFEEKWRVYDDLTLPAIEDYMDRGLVTSIPADGPIEDVTNRINKVFM